MSEERPSVLERLTSALAGSGDVEVMGALGSAQVTPGRLLAGDRRQLERLVEGSGGVGGLALIATIGRQLTALQAATNQLTYDQARGALLELVSRLNGSRKWRLTKPQVNRVAEGSLLMHLMPTCPHCHGRRYELVPGTPHTSDRACKPCAGTGQRPYPKKFRDEIAATLNVLSLIQGLMERAVAREMS